MAKVSSFVAVFMQLFKLGQSKDSLAFHILPTNFQGNKVIPFAIPTRLHPELFKKYFYVGKQVSWNFITWLEHKLLYEDAERSLNLSGVSVCSA